MDPNDPTENYDIARLPNEFNAERSRNDFCFDIKKIIIGNFKYIMMSF
jgi:hypothetical protein